MEKFSRGTVPLEASRDGKLDEIVEWINKTEKQLKLMERKLARKVRKKK